MNDVIKTRDLRWYMDTAIRYLLLALAFTPIVTFRYSLVYPYTFSKIIFFRSILEIVLVLFVSRIAFFRDGAEMLQRFKEQFMRVLREPLMLAIIAFGFSSILSTVLAVDKYHAFWGNVERGGGLFNLLHYFLFFVLSVLVFKKRDWGFFMKISMLTGFVMMLYAWLQWFGVQNFPLALLPQGRPGSFLDNPAFFGTYLLFFMMFGAISFFLVPARSGWRFFVLLLTGMAFVTIFLTDVRGAIAGLLGGIIFLLLFFLARNEMSPQSELRKFSSRQIAIFGITVLVLAAFIFAATKSAPFWDRIPGLNRIADFTLQDSSFQSRLSALRSSFFAFRDKPFAGWGVDNYQVGYNKSFDPEILLYEDAWFDRAHNMVMEMAVTQGLIGLLAYIAVFVTLFISLFRRARDSIFGQMQPYLAAGIIAYLAQNLFLFDHPVGLFMLVAGMGFIVSSRTARETDASLIFVPAFKTFIPYLVGWVVVAGGILILYFYTVIPFLQSKLFYETLRAKVGEKVLESAPRFLHPYNYLQPTIRFRFLEILTEGNLMRDPQFDPLTTIGLRAVEEVVEREPRYDPRSYIKLAEAYNEKGKDRPEFFQDAEKFARGALELSPRRPGILYPLSFALAGQDRFEEAITLAREIVDSNPKLAKSRFNLGLMLALAGQSHWDEAEQEFASALNLDNLSTSSLGSQDKSNLVTIFKEMITAYVFKEDAERLVKVAELYLRLENAPAGDLKTIIELAKDERWDILKEAVRGAEKPSG